MKRQKYLIYFIFSLTVLSCQNNSTDKKTEMKVSIVSDTVLNTSETKLQPQTIVEGEDDIDTTTTIMFKELTISISRLIAWDEEKNLNKIQGDTTYIACEIGETALGQKIKVSSNQLTEFKIEQRYETSVSISNEGPHCDLTDWKHYQSDWLTLKSLGQDTYQIADYSNSEKERFPKIEIEELKERVKKQCGDDWYELVKNITKPTEDPSWVGISKVYIRLSGKLNGQKIIKTIILEEAMGC